MTLLEKQQKFALLIARLIQTANNYGYEVTLGEAWRSPETAAAYAKQGKGIKNSLHCQRLAIDLNLFKYGKFLTGTEDYRWLGEQWELLSYNEIECCWGGRFGDGNHFSIRNNGIK